MYPLDLYFRNDLVFVYFLDIYVLLIFTTLWAYTADNKLVILFFLFFLEHRIWHFMQMDLDHLHEMSNLFF